MTVNLKNVTALVSLTPLLPFAESEARSAIRTALRRRAEEGTTHFLCPMRQGYELLMAEEALALREEYPVTVEALLPHELIAVDYPEEVRDRFFAAVEKSDRELLYSTHPFAGVEERCLRFLVHLSNSTVAVGEALPPYLAKEDMILLVPEDMQKKEA